MKKGESEMENPQNRASQPSIEELKTDIEIKLERFKAEVARITRAYETAFIETEFCTKNENIQNILDFLKME